MLRIADLTGRQLEWKQPTMMKMEFELQAGGELAATLRFRSSFGSLATAESGDGCWTFKRVGFWQPYITARACGEDADLATFRHNTWSGGGTLALPDGRQLKAGTNFWQTEMTIEAEGGAALLRYKNGGLVRMAGSMAIEPAAAALPELPWLALFGWYLIVVMYMDSAMSAATIGVTTATAGSAGSA
jgi:hypothetical protein